MLHELNKYMPLLEKLHFNFQAEIIYWINSKVKIEMFCNYEQIMNYYNIYIYERLH